jgi:hypothetical protein
MDRAGDTDPFAKLRSAKEEYAVYDAHYERIGKVDDIFLDEHDRVSYIGVKMGFFGTNSTLIPVEIIRVNDKRQLIEVTESAETIKHAPHFGRDETVHPQHEDRVRSYFGLQPLHQPREHREPGAPESLIDRFGPDERVDTEPGERAEAQERSLRGPAPVEGEETPVRTEGSETAGEPEDRWERRTAESGVTVHRRRR